MIDVCVVASTQSTLCPFSCSLNKLPYAHWPVKQPAPAERVAEDAMSRSVRLLQERLLVVLKEVALRGTARLSKGEDPFRATPGVLAGLVGFSVAVLNKEWINGLLPMILHCAYMPRDCNISVRLCPARPLCWSACASAPARGVHGGTGACQQLA